MEENQYIIISKTAIQKRIEELESLSKKDKKGFNLYQIVIVELKQTLSQSTPLIPEIEKALKESIPICDEHTLEEAIKIEEDYKKWYISNLKLDI